MTTAAPVAATSAIPAYAFAPLSQADKDRIAEMRAAFDAYYGKFAKPLQDDQNRPAKTNIIINRCGPIVDTCDDFLFGQPLKFEIPAASQDAHDYAASAWGDEDQMMALLSEIHVNGAVCGHAFVQLMPSDDPATPPRIVNLDPLTVSVVLDPDDCNTVLAFIREYGVILPDKTQYTARQVMWRYDPDGLSLANGGYDQDTTWLIGHFLRQGKEATGNFQQNGDPIPWTYPFPPIVDCGNLSRPNEFWGLSDLPRPLRDLNDSINFVESNVNEIVKYYGHPVLWASGSDAAQIERSVDAIICMPEGATLNAINLVSDLPAAQEFLNNLRADMDEQSRVPAVAFGRVAELPRVTSGIALSMLYGPLLKKVTKKRRAYGTLIREIIRRVLAIGKKLAYDPALQVELHWQSILPSDDLAEAQVALAKKQLGVSDQTLLTEMGYDPDLEIEKNQSEDAKKLANFGKGQGMPPAQLAPPVVQPAAPAPATGA